MTKTIALSAASTGLGLTLLKTFLHLNTHLPPNQQYTFILLSRTATLPPHLPPTIQVRVTNYNSHPSLVTALSGVHTLICTHGGPGIPSQLPLIRAAEEAGVRRFVPSEFAGRGYQGINLYADKGVVWEALEKSRIPEFVRFDAGIFMSVFATGTTKGVSEVGVREGCETGEEEALGGLRGWDFVVNMRAGTAEFGGRGDRRVVFTEMRDVAGFVFEALGMDEWGRGRVLGMRGDVMSFREAVDIVERVQGRTFLKRETSVQEMEEKAAAPGGEFYWQVQLRLNEGWGLVGDELNREFPNYKPTRVEEFVQKWWAGVKLGEPAWAENKVFDAEDM